MTILAFQSLTKSLTKEIYFKTLGLYRSLLRSSSHFEEKDLLKKQIQNAFKSNKYTLSRQKLTQQIEEGVKAQECLTKALNGNKQMLCYIQHFVNQHGTKKKLSISTKKNKTNLTKRKPYQVPIKTKTALGYTFKRVRGWVQPVRTSMMLKKRVIQDQKSLDRYKHFQQQLEWIKTEQIFLSELGIRDNLNGYVKNINCALTMCNKNKKK